MAIVGELEEKEKGLTRGSSLGRVFIGSPDLSREFLPRWGVCKATIPACASHLLQLPDTGAAPDPCTLAIIPLIHFPRARNAFLHY